MRLSFALVVALVLAGCKAGPRSPTRAGCPPPVAPARTCTADDECGVVFRNADCCGSLAAVGVNLSDRERAEQQERDCPAIERVCRCQADVTVADDGSKQRSQSLTVRCVQGQCTTSFAIASPPPREVGDCSACAGNEPCLQVLGGQPPAPGQPPNVSTVCLPPPAACLPRPTCECAANRAGLRGKCTVTPTGALHLVQAAP